MQAVPLTALNSSVMAAFESPALSPPSAELAQTLGKMGTNSVYEISATTSPPVSSGSSLLGDDVMPYSSEYYSTLDSQSGPNSPKDSSGNLTPDSVSSKGSETLSALEDEIMPHQGMCIPMSSSHHQGEEGATSTQIKHWTYEDQFKQLYNLSQDAERKEFLDKLFNFMQNKGSPITRVPIMAKQPLDLYKLFKLVVERGGLVEVIKKKAWRNVAKELNLPASITSAAFTMRSQYVKYLYPYECEKVKLSDPQELQMAIDSNKRDRRHSENMDFMSPQLREMESTLSPVVTTTPQALQLISSPTMALPHASVPPYSGGFIVAGGPGGTQLVQVTPHGIPIVMPAPTLPASAANQPHPPPSLSSQSQSSSEDKDDVQSHTSGESLEPPAKRPALQETTHVQMGSRAPYSIHQTSTGNFIMTHGSVTSTGAPHLIQMSPHGQLPIVLPTGGLSAVRDGGTAPQHISSKTICHPSTSDGVTVTAQHPMGGVAGGVVFSQRGVTPHNTRNLFQMAHHPHMPGLIIPAPALPTTAPAPQPTAPVPQPMATQAMAPQPMVTQNGGEERRKTEQEKAVGVSTSAIKMPFANISIQPASTKTEGEEQNGVDASLLVTLEINNTVYQGVLFAKPQALSSPQR